MSDLSYLNIVILVILPIVILICIKYRQQHGHAHEHGHSHGGQQHVSNEQFENPGMKENLEGEWREVRRYAQDVINVLNNKGYIQKKSSILDLGAGTGLYTQLFINSIDSDKGGMVYAADPSQQMRSLLQQRFQQPYLHIITPTQTSIPLSNNTVDLIFLCDVYHHLSDPIPLLKDLFRILRSNGSFVIIDSSPEHMPIMKQEISTQYPEVYQQLRESLKSGHGHGQKHNSIEEAEEAAMYRPTIKNVISQICNVGFQQPHDLTSSLTFTHHYMMVFTKI